MDLLVSKKNSKKLQKTYESNSGLETHSISTIFSEQVPAEITPAVAKQQTFSSGQSGSGSSYNNSMVGFYFVLCLFIFH